MIRRKPDVSVIVPTFNRYLSLKRLAASLQNVVSESTLDIEILIVDDGSIDQTREKDLVHGCRVIHLENQGPSQARNFGASIASSPILIFIDDDCDLACVDLEKIISSIEQGGRCLFATVGPLENRNPKWIERYLNQIGFPGRPWINKDGQLMCMPTVGFAILKEDYEAIGGFNKAFKAPGGEDDLFTRQLLTRKLAVEKTNCLQLLHDNNCGLRQFIRRHLNYGRGHEMLCSKFGASRKDYELEFSGVSGFLRFILPFTVAKLRKRAITGKSDKFLCIVQLFCIKYGALAQQREAPSKGVYR